MNPVPFVNSLRSRDEVVVIGDQPGGNMLHMRVEIPAVWDVVRIDAQSTEPIRAIKLNALHVLCPKTLFPDDYVVKLGGREVFDESLSVHDVGAKNGSIFCITHRRRRPVK